MDLSGAYVGLTGYNMGLVGLLTFIITTAGPLFFHIAMLSVVLDHSWKVFEAAKSGFASTLLKYLVFVTTLTSGFYLLAASVYSLMLVLMRNHLFIWTVFSPKFLYQLVWSGVALLNFGLALFWAALINSSRPASF